jgi:hypothetical protein
MEKLKAALLWILMFIAVSLTRILRAIIIIFLSALLCMIIGAPPQVMLVLTLVLIVADWIWLRHIF